MPDAPKLDSSPPPPSPGSVGRALYDALVATKKNSRSHTRADIEKLAKACGIEDLPSGSKANLVTGLLATFENSSDASVSPALSEKEQVSSATPAPPRKRARDEEGHFVGDDPATPENEAWVEKTKPILPKAKPIKKGERLKKAVATCTGRYRIGPKWYNLAEGQEIALPGPIYDHLKRLNKIV